MDSRAMHVGLIWALSAQAQEAILYLVDQGLDFDLAFIMVEESWPEKDFYCQLFDFSEGVPNDQRECG